MTIKLLSSPAELVHSPEGTEMAAVVSHIVSQAQGKLADALRLARDYATKNDMDVLAIQRAVVVHINRPRLAELLQGQRESGAAFDKGIEIAEGKRRIYDATREAVFTPILNEEELAPCTEDADIEAVNHFMLSLGITPPPPSAKHVPYVPAPEIALAASYIFEQTQDMEKKRAHDRAMELAEEYAEEHGMDAMDIKIAIWHQEAIRSTAEWKIRVARSKKTLALKLALLKRRGELIERVFFRESMDSDELELIKYEFELIKYELERLEREANSTLVPERDIRVIKSSR